MTLLQMRELLKRHKRTPLPTDVYFEMVRSKRRRVSRRVPPCARSRWPHYLIRTAFLDDPIIYITTRVGRYMGRNNARQKTLGEKS